MVLNSIDSQVETSPSNTCAMELKGDSNVLILDFDHTLFLSNSTEEYLDSAFPGAFCAFVLTFIDWLKPWNFFPGDNKRFVYRDAIRVITISVLFPWTYLIYRFKAPSLSNLYLNQEITQIIESRQWSKIVIASNGFDFILSPLLKVINYRFDSVIDSSIFPSQNGVRQKGKKCLIKNCLTDEELGNATCISDNRDDADLSELVLDLKLFRWPNEKRVKAGQLTYVPFLYTHASKRGNKNHVLNVMVLQDFSIFLLIYSFSNPYGIQGFFALLFLLLSFWCIYEVGYFENDLHELRHESEHKNPNKLKYVKSLQDTSFELSAWIWAIGFGGLASLMLQPSICLSSNCIFNCISTLLVWCLFLMVLRGLYRLYNYSDFGFRQFIFPLLQIARLIGPALFFSLNFLGLFLITSQMASRWLGYLIYRGGGDERRVRKRIVRHVIFVTLSIGLLIVQKDLTVILPWQLALILAWSVMQGHASSILRTFKGLVGSHSN